MGLADGQAWEAEFKTPSKRKEADKPDPEKQALERKVDSLRKQLDDARRELVLKHDRAVTAEFQANWYLRHILEEGGEG